MGSVRVDLNRDKREWYHVSFDTIETIKGLLKHRVDFDSLYNYGNTASIITDINTSNFNDEILCLYIDLDVLINRCNFNDRQNKILKMYMDGDMEETIAYDMNITAPTVNGIINSICKTIKKENDRLWLTNNMLWNYKRIDDNYKQCSKCGEWLLKEEYFSPKADNRDGFQSFCKKCNAKRMRN